MSNLILCISNGLSMYFCTTYLPSRCKGLVFNSSIFSILSKTIMPSQLFILIILGKI